MIFRRLPKPQLFERIYERMLSKWFLDESDACPVIAFTSRLPGEGVSTVVAGLARACGAADPQSVLVLDAAPSRKRVTNLLKLKASPVKFDDLEAEELMASSLVARDEKLGIDVLNLTDMGQAGGAEAQCMQLLLDQLRTNYRVILVDTGVFTNAVGAHWLACSNYRILVVDTMKATREILERQRKELDHRGIALDGTILNKRTYYIPNLFYGLTR